MVDAWLAVIRLHTSSAPAGAVEAAGAGAELEAEAGPVALLAAEFAVVPLVHPAAEAAARPRTKTIAGVGRFITMIPVLHVGC